MTNQDNRRLVRFVLLSALFSIAGCGEKEAPKPQPRSSGGMTSVAEAPRRVAASELKLHPKVQFPEDRLPESPEMAQAIADLAAAIAGGSADKLESMVAPSDRLVLNMLVSSGEWKRRSDAVKVVRVCVVNQAPDAPMQVGFGVEDAGGAFLMGWSGTPQGDSWTFSNMPIEPRLASASAGLDGAELKLLALPVGLPAADKSMKPAEEKKEGVEEKKKKPKPAPASRPGGLGPDRF
ncbi:MAG: hypothetical protein JNK58_09980 [Phycisphaerae bacterium]|nr:hypothetical protein [Phycisphaerae bacterium]